MYAYIYGCSYVHIYIYVSERNGCGDTFAKDRFVKKANIGNTKYIFS